MADTSIVHGLRTTRTNKTAGEEGIMGDMENSGVDVNVPRNRDRLGQEWVGQERKQGLVGVHRNR